MTRWAVLFLFACWLAPLGAQAHEIGTTNVRLTAHQDQTWSAEITTGPLALLNKLETAKGEKPSRDLSAEAVRVRLDAIKKVLALYIEVRFDGAVSPATVEIVRVEIPPDIAQPSFAVLRAHGVIPARAQSVSWRYGLVYSTYAVVFADCQGRQPGDTMARRRCGEQTVCACRSGRAADAPANCRAISSTRLSPHRAGRARSYFVRARNFPAQQQTQAHSGAGYLLHGRAFGYARADDVWRAVDIATHRRAADCAVDRLCRDREYRNAAADAVAAGGGVLLSGWCTAWALPARSPN